MFFGWMDMSAPSKKLQETMSLKGGTPAKDKIFTLCRKGHMSFRPKPPFLLSQESTGAKWRNLLKTVIASKAKPSAAIYQ